MSDPTQIFEERLEEIEAYLALLSTLQEQVQAGTPRFAQSNSAITVKQQRILYSSVYLQLYNLVESTITQCIDALCAAITENQRWLPGDLSTELRKEWVRYIARTHIDLNFDKRLTSALGLCDHLVRTLPITEFQVEKGAGGSWDDNLIQDISRRIGLTLRVSSHVHSSIKRPFRDEMGPLVFIKRLRNDLAHGSLSFAECGENITVDELIELKDRTATYLREVVGSFKAFIDVYEFLLPDRRP